LTLFGILQHAGEELSAHEAITAEQDDWGRSGSSLPGTTRSLRPRSMTAGSGCCATAGWMNRRSMT